MKRIWPWMLVLLLAASSTPAALIAHYRFDDGSLTDDETGSYPLTHVQTGGATVSVGLDPGGWATFPGAETDTAYLEVPGPGGASNFTVSFWFRSDDLSQGAWQGLACNNIASAAAYSWQLHIDNTEIAAVGSGGMNLAQPHAGMSAGTWYHVVLRKRSGGTEEADFYVTPIGAATVQKVGTQETNPGGLQYFRLGVNRNSDSLMRMDLYDVRIYNDATVDLDSLLGMGPDSAAVLAFDADDGYVSPGDPVQLSWEVVDADTVRIEPDVGDVTDETTGGIGQIEVTPSETSEYTLTASKTGGGSSSATVRVGVGPPRPNIVFFLVDDMGTQDTSEPFYYENGNPVITPLNQRYITPSMEALADRGMKFTHAYAMSVCTPTRMCLMTGMNSARHHVTNWTNPGGTNNDSNSTPSHNSPANWRSRGMDENDITLAQLLQQVGYRTILSGKAHFGGAPYFGSDPHKAGFDVNIAGNEIGHPGSYTGDYGQSTSRPVPGLEPYHNTGTFLTEAVTLEINQAIETAVQDDVPFFAYMTHYAVHAPFMEDTRFSANYPGLSGNALKFATMIEGMDKSLGDILAQLDALGVAEDTLVVFMGDNGSDAPISNNSAPLRGKKGNRWEGGIREACMAAWAEPNPTNTFQAGLPIPTNSVCHEVVGVFDWYPTLLGVAGVPFSHEVDGYDLHPSLAGLPGERPQEMMVHFPHDHNSDYFTTLRQGDWKLHYLYPTDTFELYHLATDVGEATNLASADPDRVMAMARRMARLLDDHGAQWPTFASSGADDPFTMPNLPAVDTDQDGLNDMVEDVNNNGLQDVGETDPDQADSDQDRTPDGTELQVGTDPLNPASAFMLEAVIDAQGELQLSWPSLPGGTFSTEQAPAIGGWGLHQGGIPAHASEPSTTLNAGMPGVDRAYFRVRID